MAAHDDMRRDHALAEQATDLLVNIDVDDRSSRHSSWRGSTLLVETPLRPA
jgi:hypothetical protein